VFENKVLRKLFGKKRKKMTGDWRMMHNEKFTECALDTIQLR
jgi:hypothetical protein